MTPSNLAVDVVVPVYNAPGDLRKCIASVLACTPRLARLVLIDDGSTDPGVAAFFDELRAGRDARIELLRNASNMGFTATANRGFGHSRHDVVLLNSDTIVTQGWLDALVACAASDSRIATVTPFSNNAEICSFPRFCEVNPCPDDPERIAAALRRAAVPTYPDLPTGVGFCMFVRRTAIEALGAFDLAFGAGYGEENDLCLRAARAGWRNVLADDAFVVHTGGRSFDGRKADLGVRNLALLSARYPHYEPMVRDYIGADPLRPIRDVACAMLGLDRASEERVLAALRGLGLPSGTDDTAPLSIALPPDSRERLRDTLAYRAWTPPVVAETVAVQQNVSGSRHLWQRLARRVLAMRRTPMGRLLYRVTPEPVIDALKARLDR